MYLVIFVSGIIGCVLISILGGRGKTKVQQIIVCLLEVRKELWIPLLQSGQLILQWSDAPITSESPVPAPFACTCPRRMHGLYWSTMAALPEIWLLHPFFSASLLASHFQFHLQNFTDLQTRCLSCGPLDVQMLV